MNILKSYLGLVCLPIFALSAQQSHFRGIPVDPNSPNLSRIGFNNCSMQSNGETLVIKNILRQGDIVFDVGANVGDWSSFALKMHDSLSIYAFEPAPKPYTSLQKRFINDSRVRLNKLAFSNSTGRANFNYYEKESTLGGLFRRPIVDRLLHQEPNCFEVMTQTLDSFCQEKSINQIDFLKIDTEGAELAVLLGARDMLSQQAIKTIQFEYGGTYLDAKITLQEIYTLLSACGYKIYRVTSNGLILIHTWVNNLENYLYSNYIATTVDEQ